MHKLKTLMTVIKNNDNKMTQDFLSDFPDDITLSNESLLSTEINLEDNPLVDSLSFIPESDFFSDNFSVEANCESVCSIKSEENLEKKFITGFKTLTNKEISINEESINKVTDKFVSGFTTGNNKQVFINKENLEKNKKIFEEKKEIKNNKIYQEFYNELYNKKENKINNEKLITTGFTTGNKKAILIKQENLIKKIKNSENLKEEINSSSNLNLSTLKESNDEEKIKKIKKDALKIKNSFFPSNYPFRSYQQPEKGHFSEEERKFEFIKQIFMKVKQKFDREDVKWLFLQFKFSWLSCLVRKIELCDFEQQINKQIQLRKEREFSVLRRICEGDDIPNKYMVFLVINTFPDRLELFDGSYSILCTVDKEISKMLLSQKIKIYSLIKICNAKLLIKPPVNILECNNPVLHLHYNSIKLTKIKHKLGYQKKCTFLRKINEINRLGGCISGIDLTITKVIEEKALVKCFDYRKEVDLNLIEKEIEKIMRLAKESNKDIKFDHIRIVKYIKCNVKDETGECLLVWYNPNYEIIRKNDKFRFINLNVNEKMIGLSLFTTYKNTFVKKIN